MLGGSRRGVNSCGVDAGVAENIGKLCNILFHSVKGSCKKMPQIMGVNLSGRNMCITTEIFHIAPYIMAAELFSAFCDKYRARLYAMLLAVL